MKTPVDDVIRHLVETSSSAVDLKQRIFRTLGPDHLQHAISLAAEIRGSAWIEGGPAFLMESEKDLKDAAVLVRGPTKALARAPVLIVLVFGLIAIALLLLFPPYVVPLPEGLINNLGFASIFAPPRSGAIGAVVNVPLLATLLFGVTVLTLGAAVVAHLSGRVDT